MASFHIKTLFISTPSMFAQMDPPIALDVSLFKPIPAEFYFSRDSRFSYDLSGFPYIRVYDVFHDKAM
jgi:hypothetical protein